MLAALGILAGGCAEEPGPTSLPPEAAAEPAPGPEPAQAAADQTNDCPAHVQCHPAWRSCHCTTNERGDLAQMEADFDGDGAPDLRVTYDYDDRGNLLRWNNDRGADGTIELPCTFEPPCPPPHPNEDCHCYGAPREVTPEYVEQRLREAGDRAEPVDPAAAQRILDSVER